MIDILMAFKIRNIFKEKIVKKIDKKIDVNRIHQPKFTKNPDGVFFESKHKFLFKFFCHSINFPCFK